VNAQAQGPVQHPVIWAVFFGAPALAGLAAGLQERGARVVLIGDDAGTPAGVKTLAVAAGDRPALASASRRRAKQSACRIW